MIMVLLTAAALILAIPAHAQFVGPSFPPPGGVTYSTSGASATGAQASGRELLYTNFDETGLGSLYWTFSSIANPTHSTQNGGTPLGAMSFSSYDSVTGIATWTSTNNAVWATAFGTQNVATRMLVQFQPYTGTNSGLLGSGWLTPTTAGAVGINTLPANWAVLDVKALANPDNYQVWYRFETAAASPLLTYYDSTNSSGGILLTGFSGGFYYTAVPEPSAWGALSAGLLAAVVLRRRRASSAP